MVVLYYENEVQTQMIGIFVNSVANLFSNDSCDNELNNNYNKESCRSLIF
jgi:hypothetical protein